MRLYLMAHTDDMHYWGGEFKKLSGYANDRLNVLSVKLFADGETGDDVADSELAQIPIGHQI